MRAGALVVVCTRRFVPDLLMAVLSVVVRHARTVGAVSSGTGINRRVHRHHRSLQRHALRHAHPVSCVKRQREGEDENENQADDATHGALILPHALRSPQTSAAGCMPGMLKNL